MSHSGQTNVIKLNLISNLSFCHPIKQPYQFFEGIDDLYYFLREKDSLQSYQELCLITKGTEKISCDFIFQLFQLSLQAQYDFHELSLIIRADERFCPYCLIDKLPR